MSSPFQTAIDALLGEPSLDLKHSDILRVDPQRDGALLAQVDQERGPQWYRCSPQGVELIELRRDKKLPSADQFGHLLKSGKAELLGWRPGKRAILKWKAPGPERILKGYRKERSEAACARFRLAQEACAGTTIQVPSVLQHDAPSEQVEMSMLPGGPLEFDSAHADLFFRLGHGLRDFQSGLSAAPAGEHDPAVLTHHGPQDEMELLSALSLRVMQMRDELPVGWSETLCLLKGKVPGAGPSELVLTHRDLHDGQLLVDDTALGMLDFDLLCLAHPALDVANLTAHLRLRALQGVDGVSESVVEQLGVALLEGLDRSGQEGFMDNLRFYQATSFLRLSLVYFLRPRWTEIVPSLVSLAARCVRELAPS